MKTPQIFKPEDFKIERRFIPLIASEGQIFVAEIAQSIFEKWLKENGKVVYADNKPFEENTTWFEYGIIRPTHQALLVCVQEIQEKECEHKKWLVGGHMYPEFSCEACGVKLKPKTFEVIDE